MSAKWTRLHYVNDHLSEISKESPVMTIVLLTKVSVINNVWVQHAQRHVIAIILLMIYESFRVINEGLCCLRYIGSRSLKNVSFHTGT